MTRDEIIGRDEELGSFHAFLDQTFAGPAALVPEGQAGIGKSTLWLAGVQAARDRGLRVLLSRTAEAERGLAHAGLGDLFENVLESVLPALSAPSLPDSTSARGERGRLKPADAGRRRLERARGSRGGGAHRRRNRRRQVARSVLGNVGTMNMCPCGARSDPSMC